MGKKALLAIIVTLLALAAPGANAALRQLSGVFVERLDHPAIRYDTRPSRDPVARLLEQPSFARSGETSLLSLLKALDISPTSQMLVFSKTSVQRALINFRNPRAIYFNDDVSVAWVRGGFIEVASQDPEQGTVFYASDQRPPLQRRDDCLSCHHSLRTAGVPGMIEPMTHRRPLELRWGGWYVTGRLGAQQHLGNVDVEPAQISTGNAAAVSWPSVEGRFDTTGYLTPYSDVAALMVFEHQMLMMNLLTRVGWEARIAAQERKADVVTASVEQGIDELVDYMLFVDEAPIATPLQGTSGFAEMFATRGPIDAKGRSLRQLDMKTRLMRFPCSYMIYSRAFDQLPPHVKEAVYRRLWEVLSGRDAAERYAHLTPDTRSAIVEILRATKPALPEYFVSSL